MEKTAIQTLKEKLPSLFENDENGFYKKLFEEMEKLEKKQIMDAYNQGYRDCEVDLNDYSMNEDIAEFTDAEQYYKQTYGG